MRGAPRRRRVGVLGVISASAALIVAGGCQQPTVDDVDPPTTIQVPVDLDTLRTAWNERARSLQRVARRGVIEFEWVDDAGARKVEPQVNLLLWIRRPYEAALRAEKAGHMLWLGANAETVWLFDALGDETELQIGSRAGIAARLHGVHPDLLIDGLGLLPMTDAVLVTAADEHVVTFTMPGASGPLRITVDRATWLPSRITSMAPAGQREFTSRLDRYDRIPLPGRPILDAPMFPARVIIEDDAQQIRVALFMEAPSRGLDQQPWDYVFDLEQLRADYPPDRVVNLDDERSAP